MEIMWFKKIHTLSLFTCIGQNKGNKDLIRLLTEYSKEWPGFNLQCGAIIASMCYWNWECFIIMFIMQVWSIFTNWNREVGEQLLHVSCVCSAFCFCQLGEQRLSSPLTNSLCWLPTDILYCISSFMFALSLPWSLLHETSLSWSFAKFTP